MLLVQRPSPMNEINRASHISNCPCQRCDFGTDDCAYFRAYKRASVLQDQKKEVWRCATSAKEIIKRRKEYRGWGWDVLQLNLLTNRVDSPLLSSRCGASIRIGSFSCESIAGNIVNREQERGSSRTPAATPWSIPQALHERGSCARLCWFFSNFQSLRVNNRLYLISKFWISRHGGHDSTWQPKLYQVPFCT